MPFRCAVCGYEFRFNRDHFPVMTEPFTICNRCAEEIWAAYMDITRDAKNFRKDMWLEVSKYIHSSKLDDKKKSIMMAILKAYSTDDNEDRHSSEIRAVMNSMFFEDYDEQLLRDWIAMDDFSEEEKTDFNFLLENEDKEVDTIMSMIDAYDMVEDDEEEYDELEYDEPEYDEEAYNEFDTEVKPPQITKAKEEVKATERKINIADMIPEVLKVIKCQDEGVIQIGNLIYRHLMRILYNISHTDEPITSKQNFLLIGPTGVGKTATVHEYCKLLGLPCVEVDMTAITKAGYVGDNITDAFRRLVVMADGDIGLAQRGIMILDEGDKNSGSDDGDSKDPGGRAVMIEMLKKLEGCDVTLGGGVVFNTSELLFICIGTFEGAYKARSERLSGKKRVGFGNLGEELSSQPGRFIAEDIIKGGAPAEWIGRFPCIVEFKKLTDQGYATVLTDSKRSVFLENKKLMEFAYGGLELVMTPEGVKKIARQAVKYDVGVRGLNRIITELLEEVEGKLITRQEVYKKVVIGETVTYE